MGESALWFRLCTVGMDSRVLPAVGAAQVPACTKVNTPFGVEPAILIRAVERPGLAVLRRMFFLIGGGSLWTDCVRFAVLVRTPEGAATAQFPSLLAERGIGASRSPDGLPA